MPTTTRDLLHRALALQQNGAHEESISYYRAHLRLHPNLDERAVTHNLGVAYDSLARSRWSGERVHEALAMQQHAVRFVGHAAASVYTQLGKLHLFSERRTEAEAAFASAIAVDPTEEREAHKLLLRCRFDAVLESLLDGSVDVATDKVAAVHARLVSVLRAEVAASRWHSLLCPPANASAGADREDDAVPSEVRRAAERLVATGHVGQWVADERQLLAARRSLLARRPHTIANALSAGMVAEAQRTLAPSSPFASAGDQPLDQPALAWDCNASEQQARRAAALGQRNAWCRRCVATGARLAAGAVGLRRVRSVLESAPLRRVVAWLAGEDGALDGDVISQATRYRPGHFLAMHNDVGEDRIVAFAWHLHDSWRAGDGGELAVVCPEEGGERLIPPLGNSLTLFLTHGVSASGEHAVMPVVRERGAGRLAISGWFTKRVG